MALRWGIISAGAISHDFVTALSTLPKSDHQIIAIAARNLQNAKDFAKLHEIPTAFGSYKQLAESSNIDIAYIGVLHPLHYEISKLMLENGKHVLCEKPMCMNAKQARKLIEISHAKKLFLMEAIWSRFFPSYQYVRKQINDGVLGAITEVHAEFGYDHTNNERLFKKDMGGGSILDLGVYTIQAVQWILRDEPISINATGQLNDEGVDLNMNATLRYKNGSIATVRTNSMKFLDNIVKIKGTKGEITINQIWSSLSIIDVDGNEKTWTLPIAKHKFNYPNSCGLKFQAEAARQSIRNGSIENENVPHNESLIIARIEDEIRKQIGVRYDVDDLDYN